MRHSFPILVLLTVWHSAYAAPIAVVELFTSEHCPSCPPAEVYLKDIAANAAKTGEKVFAIEYHVDYWAEGAKADPLRLPEFETRQRAYGKVMGLDEVYTPQMIVNGKLGFTGSERSTGKVAIANALKQETAATVQLKAIRAEKNISVKYETSGMTTECVVNVVLVQRSVKTKRATYVNVVRSFKAMPPGIGEIATPLPTGVAARDCFVMAFIQNRRTFIVSGAVSTLSE